MNIELQNKFGKVFCFPNAVEVVIHTTKGDKNFIDHSCIHYEGPRNSITIKCSDGLSETIGLEPWITSVRD